MHSCVMTPPAATQASLKQKQNSLPHWTLHVLLGEGGGIIEPYSGGT